MKKTVLYFIFFLLAGTTATAQSTLEKLILEDAKTAYANNNYKLCIEKIEELEKKGNKGLVLAHLKIMAVSKMPSDQLGFERIVQFKKDVANYLKNYDNEDFLQQYKEVYEVSKMLSDKKYDEGILAEKNAVTYYNAKDYKNAMQWFLKADSHGSQNSNIGYYVGYMYATALGTETNYTEAAKWYTKAANQGSASAQNNLGILYENGQGVEKDYKKAAEWYTKAANQGSAYGQHGLGNCYRSGKGVEKDLNKAIEWYKKAVEQGYWMSFYSLAHCYVQTNNHQQLILLCEKVIADSKFKQTEKASAMQMLGESYGKGNGVPKDISKAIEWYTKAASEGSTEAMYHLGLLYHDGTDISQDYAKAVEWVRKAADKGYVKAMADMGILYAEGKAIAQDYALAKQWYEKAAEKGSLTAMNHLGGLYAEGYGVEQDYKKAMEWFQKAADKELVNAIANIGNLYYGGKGVIKDYAVALQYFEKVEQKIKNNSSLYDTMADCYLETGNKEKAKEYYQKAADLGSEKAIEWLKENK